MVMVVAMVMGVIMCMVVGPGAGILQSKWHRFDEGVHAQTHEGQQSEAIAVDVTVLHAFAEVLEPHL